jgi:hypothetical protein
MILNGSHIIDLVRDYRLCWISGRYGAGKTLFAFEIAEQFLERGYRLISNTQSPWNDDWDKVNLLPDGRLKAVVLMDEAGLTLKYQEQLELMCAYSRKMDCIYLFPSYFPPVRYAQVLNMHSVYGFQHLLIPLRVWECRIKIGGWRDKTTFLTTQFEKYYGVYSSQAVDIDTEKIIEFMAERVEQFREHFGGKRIRTVESARTSPIKGFEDSVNALAEVADDFSSLSFGSRKRK